MPNSAKIKKISALEILDSRGIPTLSVKVELQNGIKAQASVPSGTSAGQHEELELRDGNPARYNGKGVLKAVYNVAKAIFPKLKGQPVSAQKKIDQIMLELDGTENKSRLGANSILGVSVACARAAADSSKLPLYAYLKKNYSLPSTTLRLPTPMFNLLNGGQHADSGMDIQEFLFIPRASNFSKALEYAAEVFYEIKRILKSKKLETGVGLEGGFEPKLRNSKEAIEQLLEAVKAAGVPKGAVGLGLDVAASGLFDKSKDQRYIFKRERVSFSREQLIGWYAELARSYPLISIEDGLDENDWEGWKILYERLGNKLLIIGDDLTVTNPKRLLQVIKQKVINGVIIKPNQVGTLSETMACIGLAQQYGLKTVISHRSGDTVDTFITDLAVAVGADFLKAGATSRGERLEKYNRLLEIEKELS